MKKKLTSTENIALLIDSFYDKVLKDDLLASHFKHINFEEHKPQIVKFWAMVLLDETGYTTNVFDKHKNLPIQQAHFDRWLALFNQTLDELFEGENVELAKQRAAVLGYTFGTKMQALAKN